MVIRSLSVLHCCALKTQSMLRVLVDNDGVTLVEYALLLSLIAVVCIVSVKLVGQHASTVLSSAAASL